MKALGLVLLSCLCAASAYRLFDGWLAVLWVPGALAVPWLLRDEIANRITNPLPLALTLAFLLLALFTTGCATRPTELQKLIAERKAKEQADYGEHRIAVATLPSGALIDWNNDVIGTSPCEIVIPRSYQGHWPRTGYQIETIHARWLDGTLLKQTFVNNSKAPRRVAFLHPNPALHHPQPVILQQ